MPALEDCCGGDGPAKGAPQSSGVSTVAGSFRDGLSESSSRSGEQREAAQVGSWSDIKFAHRIQPYCQHAHCVDDLRLLSCLLELASLRDVEGEAVKLLLRVLRFLRLCDYSLEDICSILAHASAYFNDAYALCGTLMDASEVGNVLATLVFIAHCHVQDETCPLRIWHKHLFRKYCPLTTLNAAVVRLLEIRHYKLRLESDDLSRRFNYLMQSTPRYVTRPVSRTAGTEKDAGASPAADCAAGLRGLSLGGGSRPKRRQCGFNF